MRYARHRWRPGGLLGCLPRCRPGHEGRHRRALCHPGRCLPQCRLHPVQGPPACRLGRRGGQGFRGTRHQVRQARDRHRRLARLERESGQPHDHGSCRHGQGPQGHHRARLCTLPRSASRRGGSHRGQRAADHRQGAGGALQPGHHRGRQRARAAALPAAGRPHCRLHRRAGTALRAQAHAGHRRRHHRPGNGHRLCLAGRPGGRGRDARRRDGRCRPRHGQGLAEVQREASGPPDGQDPYHRRQGHTRRHRGQFRGRERPRGSAGL